MQGLVSSWISTCWQTSHTKSEKNPKSNKMKWTSHLVLPVVCCKAFAAGRRTRQSCRWYHCARWWRGGHSRRCPSPSYRRGWHTWGPGAMQRPGPTRTQASVAKGGSRYWWTSCWGVCDAYLTEWGVVRLWRGWRRRCRECHLRDTS